MRTLISRRRIRYDGSQLSSHWIYRTFGIVGSAAVSFRGPCDVLAGEMADVADLLHGPGIRSEDMVHVMVELFDELDLLRAVLRQRLLAAIAAEVLGARAGGRGRVTRAGDDLYVGTRKLSVSVATVTPVSTVIHFGVNVTGRGAPQGVRAAGLVDVGADPRSFASDLLAAFTSEMDSVEQARCLVRGKP